MTFYHTLAGAALCMALSGCFWNDATSGKNADIIDSSPGIDTGDVDASGEADFLMAYQYVRGAAVTPTMPSSGSANYAGGMGADATGGVKGFLTGAIDMKVHDLSNGRVSGSIEDFALYNDDGSKKRDLGGVLVINGKVAGNKLDTTATGKLLDDKNGKTIGSRSSLDLDGVFRSLDGRASAATGTVTGGGTGAFNYALSNGQFYLIEVE